MSVRQGGDDRRVVPLLDNILARAWRERASDIHFEPQPGDMRLRFRVDGILSDKPAIPAHLASAVVSRLKVLARLDIAERRVPQDGGFRTPVDGVELNVRVSTFPAAWGEKVVVRLLAPSADVPRLEGLGLVPEAAATLRELVRTPSGVLLVTGPTGAGKTTTLYALLQELDARRLNIVTLEDPIEVRFTWIVQGQVNEKAGFTFERGLRAILRQDPDVIMVGEMRDRETADIAFKAGLTGHLVLSTLHTNSVVETFVRLVDMGLERYVVASALRAVVAQRLVRRLCDACKREIQPSPGELALFDEPTPARLWEAAGCSACHRSGYLGRTGIYEVVPVDEGLADRIKSPDTTRRAYQDALARRGARGLRAQGLALARQGVTSVAEVLRVT